VAVYLVQSVCLLLLRLSQARLSDGARWQRSPAPSALLRSMLTERAKERHSRLVIELEQREGNVIYVTCLTVVTFDRMKRDGTESLASMSDAHWLNGSPCNKEWRERS
jgi:hypothetical protein